MYCSLKGQSFYGQSPQFARADVDDVSEYKAQGFAGQSAHVNDHGFHLATLSSAACAVNMII